MHVEYQLKALKMFRGILVKVDSKLDELRKETRRKHTKNYLKRTGKKLFYSISDKIVSGNQMALNITREVEKAVNRIDKAEKRYTRR